LKIKSVCFGASNPVVTSFLVTGMQVWK